MNHKKIAIITAYIGNGGKTGELTFTPEAQKDVCTYGVDVYRFNNDNMDLLKPYFKPSMSRPEVIHKNGLDKLTSWFNLNFRYKQGLSPSETDNYTRLIAKIPKILFYKIVPLEYDYYIWLDSKFTIHMHWLDYVLWLINRYPFYDIITSKHSERNSVKAEYNFMAEYVRKSDQNICRKYKLTDIAYQYYMYKKNKWFVDDRLYELTMIIYSKNMAENNVAFLEEWYAHNHYLSIQDQLSFPLLATKYKIKIKGIEQRVFDMPFVHHEYSRL